MRYLQTVAVPTKAKFTVLVGRGNQICQRSDEVLMRTGRLLVESQKRLVRTSQLIEGSTALLKRG